MAVIILDTESSGHLGDHRASVIEVGAVAQEGSWELGSFSSLIQPLATLGAWSSHAMEINKISEKALYYAPNREEVFSAFVNWMSLFKPIEAVFAYNVSFDQKIMIKTWPMAEHLPWGPCVMRAASAVLEGHRKGIKLVVAAKSFGYDHAAPNAHHRALADARATAHVWSALVERGAL